MKTNIKIFIGVIALVFVAYRAYAENVAVSTFYPSPFGSYQDLTVTNVLTTATENVQTLNVGGVSTFTGTARHNGNVGIGTAPTGNALEVSGNTNVTGSATAGSVSTGTATLGGN